MMIVHESLAFCLSEPFLEFSIHVIRWTLTEKKKKC